MKNDDKTQNATADRQRVMTHEMTTDDSRYSIVTEIQIRNSSAGAAFLASQNFDLFFLRQQLASGHLFFFLPYLPLLLNLSSMLTCNDALSRMNPALLAVLTFLILVNLLQGRLLFLATTNSIFAKNSNFEGDESYSITTAKASSIETNLSLLSSSLTRRRNSTSLKFILDHPPTPKYFRRGDRRQKPDLLHT